MRSDKEKAIELRQKGLSYKAIRDQLGIPLSTLASWFKLIPWSGEITSRLSQEASFTNPDKIRQMALANKLRWQRLREGYREAALREFEEHARHPLFIPGLMLYWGEGERQPKSSIVRLGNSEPEMIRIFYLFLTKTLGISSERISAWLLLYPDLVDSIQRNFWSKATGISSERFTKSIYIKGRHPTKRLSYGVCTLVINSRALKERMLVWIELAQEFLRTETRKLEKNENPRILG